MAFPLGKPVLVMGVISLLAGGWLWISPRRPPADLTLWVFAGPHFQDYNDRLRPLFQQQSGQTLAVDLIANRAMDMQLAVLFMAPGNARQMPDAVEVEIGSIGRYLRPPVNDIGFLPLNRYLRDTGFREIASLNDPGQPGWNARLISTGKIYTFEGIRWKSNPLRTRPDAWINRILPSRLNLAAKAGEIFAVPHDVNPVTLTFRADLFAEAGVPLTDVQGRSTVRTWAQLQERCLQFQNYWRQRHPHRHAMELPQAGAGVLSVMLQQRHVSLIDAEDRIHLNDPVVAQTLAFYAQLVAGDRQIGAETASETGMEFTDLANGNFAALLTPDWKIDFLKQYVPRIAGKLRMIPLPRFDPADADTATYGGTLIGIPRGSHHPQAAWKLIEFLYFSPAGLADRQRLGILPPLPEEWNKPQYHQRDPFFGGQKTLELYAELARDLPPTRITPLAGLALGTLAYVQSLAVQYVRTRGSEGLESRCQHWLDEAAVDLHRRIEHAKFDEVQ